MKKLVLAFAAFGLLATQVNAQIQMDNPPSTVYGGYADGTISTHFDVMNTGNSTIATHMFRMDANALSGTSNYFCWGVNCYPPSTSHSTVTTDVAAGATEGSFIGYYLPNNVQGISPIGYCIYVEGDSANTVVCHTINYDASFANGLEEQKRVSTMEAASPNPANQMATVAYNNAGNRAELVLFDMLGSKVQSQVINHQNGVVIINTTDLKNGVYFYSMVVDGQTIATQKLIVAH